MTSPSSPELRTWRTWVGGSSELGWGGGGLPREQLQPAGLSLSTSAPFLPQETNGGSDLPGSPLPTCLAGRQGTGAPPCGTGRQTPPRPPMLRVPATPPPPRASPGRQRGPATVTRDFLFFFCWFQAFFCLSENETNTPCASPPPDTHAHRQSRTRAPGLPAAVSGAGPSVHKQPRAGPSGERAARCPAPTRFLAPLPAARCPPPRRSARRPAGPSAGGTPRPGTPSRARAEAARRLFGQPRTTPGPGAEAQASPERAQLLRIRWVPRGAARAPQRPRARPGPGRRAPSEGGAGRGRTTAPALPCCCPACVPAFVLVATTAPNSDPVSVPILSLSLPLPSLPDSGRKGRGVGFPRGSRGGGGRGQAQGARGWTTEEVSKGERVLPPCMEQDGGRAP